ncbi:ATP-binding protein [Kitasatospora aburaviensis]
MQEALTNVVRHAAVDHCRVAVGYGDEELSVEVVDDGRGAPGAPGPAPGCTTSTASAWSACGSGSPCCTAGSASGRGRRAASGWRRGFRCPSPWRLRPRLRPRPRR